jgi:hypothetical protein
VHRPLERAVAEVVGFVELSAELEPLVNVVLTNVPADLLAPGLNVKPRVDEIERPQCPPAALEI